MLRIVEDLMSLSRIEAERFMARVRPSTSPRWRGSPQNMPRR